MGGLFGVISKRQCVTDLFYGIDYHSHLGTKRGGMAVLSEEGTFSRSIHNIEGSYFRIKFEPDLPKFVGLSGIGVISDTDSQPILVNSRLGRFAIVTVGKVNNLKELEQEFLDKNKNFSELSSGTTNQTELVSHLITEGNSFAEGIEYAQKKIKGSCSMLLLTQEGIIAARDLYGRTPLTIGKKDGSYAVASDDSSFPNLGFENEYIIGPGEAQLITSDGYSQIVKKKDKLQICSFLWIYYGYPTSTYEGVNVDNVRYHLGRTMGMSDDTPLDVASGIPDSGTCMAIGYSYGKGVPYRAAIVKYTPTWPRSFTPTNQSIRDLVAKMKLIPNYALMRDKRVAFCDDSIVRGTQLRDNVETLFRHGAKEVHIRISCPPLVYPCPFINFSPSRGPLELITRRFIQQEEGDHNKNLKEYSCYNSTGYKKMIAYIKSDLKMNSLRFNSIEALVDAIGLPKECLCTHCFDGSSYGE